MSQEQSPIRSRRELRQARDKRLEANQDAGTPGSGGVRPASGRPAPEDPAPDGPAADGPAADRPAGGTADTEVSGRRRVPGPVDSVRSTTVPERTSQVRARDRATLRTIKELAEKEVQLAAGGPLTRRQLRLLQLAAETVQATAATTADAVGLRTRATPVAPRPGKGPATLPGVEPAPAPGSDAPAKKSDAGPSRPGGQPGMTVEQALAARELLARQARNQLAKMEHINASGSRPDVPAEEVSPPEPARNDPATANNLAMVTPLEFVQVPGVERPVLKRPATSHIPIVTLPDSRVDQPRKSGSHRPAAFRRRGEGPAAGSAGALARAEAAAAAASGPRATAAPAPAAGAATGPGQAIPAAASSEEDFTGRGPVAAKAAYGLDPLDAATAGLGRARRLRMVQLGVLALGLVALIVGLTLIITGLSG